MSTAQILIRYSLQKGYTPIVKATSRGHLYANKEVENLVISEQDMEVLDSWDKGTKGSLCMSFHTHSHLSAKRYKGPPRSCKFEVVVLKTRMSLPSYGANLVLLDTMN